MSKQTFKTIVALFSLLMIILVAIPGDFHPTPISAQEPAPSSTPQPPEPTGGVSGQASPMPASDEPRTYSVMHPNEETLRKWIEDSKKAPNVHIDDILST